MSQRPPFVDASNRPPLELEQDYNSGIRYTKAPQEGRSTEKSKERKRWPSKSVGTSGHDSGRREIRAVREVRHARRNAVNKTRLKAQQGRQHSSEAAHTDPSHQTNESNSQTNASKPHTNEQQLSNNSAGAPGLESRRGRQTHNTRKGMKHATLAQKDSDSRSTWMSRTEVISSRGAGTGLFAKPSRGNERNLHMQKGSQNGKGSAAAQSDRDELISLRVEVSSQKQVVQLLTNRINQMTSEVERSRLAARAMEGKLIEAQNETKRLTAKHESNIGHEDTLHEQMKLLERELAAVRLREEAMQDKFSRVTHERDRLRQELVDFKERRAQETVEEEYQKATVQELQGLNAGLRRQLKDEQQRIVEAQAKVREAQKETRRLQEVVSLRDVALQAEREARHAAERSSEESANIATKLKERMAKLVDKLNKEADSRRTAIARAEATGSKAKKMESEMRSREQHEAEYDAKISNLKGQIAMKDRRIQLMRKQHQGEIASHEATLNEKKALEKEVESIQYDLDIANATISELKRGGPVVIPGRDSLDDFKPISMAEAMAMDVNGGKSKDMEKREPQKQRVNHNKNAKKKPKSVDNVTSSEHPKKSRRENLNLIRQMMLNIPDASKLPGSNAPAWMIDDSAEVI